MAQYSAGSVTVTKDSNIVLGDGTEFLSYVQVGDLFLRSGDNLEYVVGAVDSDVQLQLTSNYLGTSGISVPYAVARDFTANLALPIINPGDIETASLLRRIAGILDAIVDQTGTWVNGPVSSVFGRVGDVASADGDYNAGQIIVTPPAGMVAVRVQALVEELKTLLDAHEAIVTGNPHGVTKAEVGLGSADNTADVDKPVSTAQQTALDLKEDLANKDQPLGYAGLDAAGKLAINQVPDTVLGQLEYQTTWNADTNTPAIPVAASTNKGHYYKVAVAGATDIDGITDWKLGDWVVSNGTTWDKVDNSESVPTVFGRAGAILPLSGDYNAGQITVTPAGTLLSTDVQAALEELDSDQQAHVNATGNVHSMVASQLPTTPVGDITATDTQAFVAEVDSRLHDLELRQFMGI